MAASIKARLLLSMLGLSSSFAGSTNGWVNGTRRNGITSTIKSSGSDDDDRITLDDRPGGSVESLLEPVPIMPYWSAKRHLTCGNPTPPPPWVPKMAPWRSSPGKLKTANAALVLCLNIDVDPPDVIKTNPCAVMECWVEPHSMPSHKALEVIGTNLQHQFEGLSPKLSYKPILDPSYEDLRRFCTTLRKQAKEDTVLFYYNGHGVPKPTPSGELWCFNRNYTQYIPVSLAEVQHWLGTPCVYIWDCSAAGNLLLNFNNYAQRRDQDNASSGTSDSAVPFSESIQLAACAASELLPSSPELPADLFTSCLTSPIDIALRYHIMNNQLPNIITADMVMQLPGDLKDRRTPLGELNWIFTAITDTIAWTSFSRELFTRLYRSDLLVASLFRNFLLAERIMKNYGCTPHTSPSLPPTNTHPLWASWDLAVDACVRQMPELLKHTEVVNTGLTSSSIRARRQAQAAAAAAREGPHGEKPYTYIPSRFFADQLTAFQVWISRGGSALTRKGPLSLPIASNETPDASEPDQASKGLYMRKDSHLVPRKPPEQLPIVLQVLLSQPHRLRALILLSQFVDLGPWAVHLALAIGIFPYISKLLQAGGQDLRPVLIFIWARIMAVDPSCQVDLCSNGGYRYFANILASTEDSPHPGFPNSSEHKAMCAFVLSAICRDFAHGQQACLRERVFHACFERLSEEDFLLRQWCSLCVGMMWDGNDEIKVFGVDNGTQDRFIVMLSDDAPEVRAAALFALGTFMGASGSSDPNKRGGGGTGTMAHLDERVHFRMEVAVVTGGALAIKDDASPMVRKELLVLISCLVKEWRGFFVACSWIYWEEDQRWRGGDAGSDLLLEEDVTGQAISEWLDSFQDEDVREENKVIMSSFFTIFTILLEFSVDPYHEVAAHAQTIVDYIMALLFESPFMRLEGSSLHIPPAPRERDYYHRSRRSSLTSSPSLTRPPSPNLMRPSLTRNDTMASTISSGVSNTLKRTSSFANALKNLAGGIAFPSLDDSHDKGHAPSHLRSHAPSPPPLHSRHHSPVDNETPPRAPSPNLNFAQYIPPYSRPGTPLGPRGSIYSRSAPASPTSSWSSTVGQRPLDFLPSDVMEALMEEDMERLRARRRHQQQPLLALGKRQPASPAESASSEGGNGNVVLGLGTGAGIRDVLPLKSRFYDWCVEYFKEPQMRQAEADESGSIEYNYQAWRQQRNEKVQSETQAQVEIAEGRPWDKPVTQLHIMGVPLSMAFHSFDPHIVVANEVNVVSVWDWSKKRQLASFHNGNPKGATITSAQFINQDVGGLVLISSADGMIRLYRNYDPATSNTPVQMVSAFRGLNDIVRMQRGSGAVINWKQAGGFLHISGDTRIIRVWDAHTETQLLDMATKSDSPVTTISSENGPSSTVIAGFADGIVKVFDRRLDEDDSVVRAYNEHYGWVQNVRWHPHLPGQFLSASMSGEIKLWDIRGTDRAAETWVPFADGIAAFDVHGQAGVFASCSAPTHTNWKTQKIVVQSLAHLNMLSSIDQATGLTTPPTRSWPSQYIPRSSSLVFHPLEMLYGVGTPDGTVRIFGSKLT
ncbi:hypothetical protein K488DRAFT_77642 [Vararia minispora EC-137]|uniref:Uncharacterized protein n=1 Tax=Vararia minispora EC-137 TaxID=1314806 RepID=A0ACB8QR46_9AGAM|nr:hypothetical protein K488DRAFT_77642 [Vararia minispora EC-137]